MLNKVIEGKFDEISQLQDELSKQKDLAKESNDTNERLMKVCPVRFSLYLIRYMFDQCLNNSNEYLTL